MLRRMLLVLMLLAVLLVGWGYRSAVQEPTMRTARISVEGWPSGEQALRLLLVSDVHVAGPDMPPERLAAIVSRFNALEPDLVLIAGDLVSDKRLSTRRYTAREAVAPLAALRARHGVFAVLGNHDHWRDAAAIRAALAQTPIRLLDNEAVRAGPVTLIGLDDIVTGHADPARAFASAARLDGPEIVVSHSPDIVPELPRRIALVAAGHTHCGQIRLPLVGRLSTASRYGERFACGLIEDEGQRVVVGAGLGTSILPLRLGVPPEFWLIEIGPRT